MVAVVANRVVMLRFLCNVHLVDCGGDGGGSGGGSVRGVGGDNGGGCGGDGGHVGDAAVSLQCSFG